MKWWNSLDHYQRAQIGLLIAMAGTTLSAVGMLLPAVVHLIQRCGS